MCEPFSSYFQRFFSRHDSSVQRESSEELTSHSSHPDPDNCNGAEDEVASDQTSESIGHFSPLLVQYTFIGHLGSGGFGSVCQYRNRTSGKNVALKKVQILTQDQDEIDKILREARVLATLGPHPNVVTLNHAWVEKVDSFESVLYMDTELCSGGSLRAYLNGTYSRELPKMTKLFKQIISGVSFIHSFQILHRDLKPDNVMFTMENVLKICDFGISRVNSESTKTQHIGTRPYMSPEVENSGHYTEAVDIWAMGIILIEMEVDLSDVIQRQDCLNEARTGNVPKMDHKELAKEMLNTNPERRPTAKAILTRLQNY